MEQEYVIGVRNKFAGFLEEGEDPYDILKNVEAENKKKKALKVSISNENKENKSKDANEVKSKAVKKPAAIKATDRVLPGTGERGAKPDSAAPADRPNRRNKEESADFPRTGSFRDGNKPDGSRGPRNDNRDGPRGERRDRDGPRPFRDERERRGPRPEGDRPFRQRDGAGSDGEGRPPRRERREFGQDSGFDGESRPERRTGGPRGRGSRPPGRSFEGRGGKREFDRRSGSDRTGVKPVEKRDGAGSFNWDSTKDCEALIPDLNETNTSDEPDWNNTPTTDADAAPAPKENDENEEVAAPVEEEPQELTLDEYRKLRGTRERPQFDIRKPGEGEDLSQWKNMIEIKKKEDKVEEEEFELADIPQRAGRQKHVVIDITFNDVFRGGRGRGRGRGGREGRDNRDREPREFREPREPREFREPREPREYREPREFREPREPREYREPREPRGDRAERGDGPPQRRFPPREERRGGGSAYEDRGRPSVPKVDDEKAFPSLG